MLKDELLRGAKGAAEYSGLTARQIYHLADQGLLPCRRLGKSLYFLKADLDAAFRSAANG